MNEGKREDIAIAFNQYKKAYFRYMIMDILVEYKVVNTEVGFLNKVLKRINESVDIPDIATMKDVQDEIKHLKKMSFIESIPDNNIKITQQGWDAVRSLLFESLANSCSSNYTSLKVSVDSLKVSRTALRISIIALGVSIMAIISAIMISKLTPL